MKEVRMFMCLTCGETYHTQKAAEMCEKAHYAIKEISPKYALGRPQPQSIDIVFVNNIGCKIKKRFWLG